MLAVIASLIISLVQVSGIRDDIHEIRGDIKIVWKCIRDHEA